VGKVTYLDLLAQYEVNSAHPGGPALTRLLLHNETITPNMTLLDVGCGTGQTVVYIAKHYPCKVIAIDINPKMLEKARQKLAKDQLDIPLIRANAMDLPFHKNSFDIILAESVTIFTKIHRTLREYYRVLKPSGTLLAIEATALSPLTKDETSDFQRVLGINCLPTKDEWRQMFQAAGFPNVQVLLERRMNWMQSLSPKMNQAFGEYFNILFRHRNKFGYGVYRCRF
jgi:cyclopropane fatty-acyl-phospholipid synthase-like methyltransferase